MTKEINFLIRDKYNGDQSDAAAIARDMERLTAGEPLAYVIGWVPFLDLRIELVSPSNPEIRALIPRSETEWWTEKLIAHLRDKFGDQSFTLLDLCAGSGAIGLAVLKNFSNAQVTFTELVPELAVLIKRNIEIHQLDAHRATIITSDLFNSLPQEKFDMIATNPPYIPQGRELDQSVTEYEPHTALFSGADGMTIINRIITDAPAYIHTNGELWMECDISNVHDAQVRARAAGASASTVHQDLSGRPRLLVAHFE